MDLNWVKIRGFKRFEEATLNTSGKIIALVGPNEAGKSSILEALPFLNNDIKLSEDIHLTRNKGWKPEDIILEAGFLLDEDDREAISHLYESEQVRWFYIKKPVSGQRKFEIKPILNLPIQDINKLIDNVETIKKYWSESSKVLEQNKSVQSPEYVRKECKILIEKLKAFANENTKLSTEIKNEIKTFYTLIVDVSKKINTSEEECFDEYRYVVSEIEKSIKEYNKLEDPNQEAINILKDRIPKFLIFNDANRNLQSNLNLATLDKLKPNQALDNLLKMADVDIAHLSTIFKQPTIIRSTINKINIKIKEIYEGKWSQSTAKPVIDVNGSILRVFIENEEKDNFELSQRSDGLRQFIALINFLEMEHAEQPILLVDEAELHLHYDAQADLIEIFTKQKFAAKIIYTTHSVGCLPEDLGTGVKLVSPVENLEERSTITKNFWSKDKRPGVLPLLFGMGASQLTFMAIRQTVFVEGSTDILLLPTLFRQATQKDHVGFQIVQGIAMTQPANFGLLENHAPKVAFLLDNDPAGQIYKKQLEDAGIDPQRIFLLPACGNTTVLEDYLRKDLYLEVVNQQIKNWNTDKTDIDTHLMSLENIPDENCPEAVEKWCKSHGLKIPDKVPIAYDLLDLATSERQEQVIKDGLQDKLAQIYHGITQIFHDK